HQHVHQQHSHAHRPRQVAERTTALLALARIRDAVPCWQWHIGDRRLHLILEVANQVAIARVYPDRDAARSVDVVDRRRYAHLFKRSELTQFHITARTVHGQALNVGWTRVLRIDRQNADWDRRPPGLAQLIGLRREAVQR